LNGKGQFPDEQYTAEQERCLLRHLPADRLLGSLARFDLAARADEITLSEPELLASEEHLLATAARPQEIADADLGKWHAASLKRDERRERSRKQHRSHPAMRAMRAGGKDDAAAGVGSKAE
jgi:hypothetical protein